MTSDRELIRRFARHGAEEAFAALVSRHIDLVYGTALRHLRENLTRAAEVTQAVFTAAASQGGALARHPSLADWLYRTTQVTALAAVRTERLRQERESASPALPASTGAEDLSGVTAGLLHELLTELDAADRTVILLRFYGGHSPGTVGVILGGTEDSARAHVGRAVDALCARLAGRGIQVPGAALTNVLTNQVIAAPVDLAATVTAGALTAAAALVGPAPAAPGRPLARGVIRALPWVAGAAALGALGLAVHFHHTARQREEEMAQGQQERERLARALAQSDQRAADAAVKVRELSAKVVELVSKPEPPRPPPPAKVEAPRPDPTLDLRRLRATRMAQYKPYLEAGRPIRGAVVVLVEGKPVQRPVAFVIGRETRIEAVDDGTYVIVPALNPDGSVKYQITILRRDPATGLERAEALPAVTQTPWDPFTVGGPGGRALAFDPDEGVP